jgi:hypothetical protein
MINLTFMKTTKFGLFLPSGYFKGIKKIPMGGSPEKN